MKNLIMALVTGLIISGCDKANSNNQFIGTWQNISKTDQTLTITQNEGGSGFTVTRAIPSRTIGTFPATADGNTLIVNIQVTSTVFNIKDGKLFAHMIPSCYKDDCDLWTKVK